jgi:hypothetical protein
MSPKPNLDQGGYGFFAGSPWGASQLRASSDLIRLIPSSRGLAGVCAGRHVGQRCRGRAGG